MCQYTVSIIVPFYRGGKTLGKTIASLLAQSYENIEVIVVDDGSPEPVEAALGEWIDHPKLKLIKQANTGVAGARNTGIRQAMGELIAFCDQDDLWHPSKLELQVPRFSNLNVGLVYSWQETIPFGAHRSSSQPQYTGQCFHALAISNFIICCTVVARKNLIGDIGMFNAARQLQGCDDRHLWLRLARLCEFDVVCEPLANHVIHGNNLSLDEPKMLAADVYCLEEISRLPDLSDSERRSCHKGFLLTYLHYANNLFHVNNYRLAGKCLYEAWKIAPARLDYAIGFLLLTATPASALNLVKSLRRRLKGRQIEA